MRLFGHANDCRDCHARLNTARARNRALHQTLRNGRSDLRALHSAIQNDRFTIRALSDALQNARALIDDRAPAGTIGGVDRARPLYAVAPIGEVNAPEQGSPTEGDALAEINFAYLTNLGTRLDVLA